MRAIVRACVRISAIARARVPAIVRALCAVHRGEGLNMRREMVADADECAGLCGREPVYGSDGDAMIACYDKGAPPAQ
jgi:hypothetical protein